MPQIVRTETPLCFQLTLSKQASAMALSSCPWAEEGLTAAFPVPSVIELVSPL